MTLPNAALDYASNRNLPVFPLKPRDKGPLIAARHGGRGFHDATTDPDQIRAWWNATPTANIGIRPPKGFLVLDIDPRHGGDVELERMSRRRGQLPKTWTTHTGSGGFHLWYHVGDLSTVRGELCAGVDIKTHATGYLMSPPSVHPNGHDYQWITEPQGDPTRAPVWLRLAVQPPPGRHFFEPSGEMSAGNGEYTLGCLVGRIGKAPERRRNRTFYGACKDALRQGDLDAFEDDLVGAARAIGLTEAEIASTVKSARRSGSAT